MDNKELLIKICNDRLAEKNLLHDKSYKKRLNWEIKEIFAKNKEDYFLDLYNREVKFATNENNLLVANLLGLVSDHSIVDEPNCKYGEFPDIDIDYIPIVRDYLKTIWSIKEFGAEFVCNISNYTTFGLKSALIDMVRVHGESREEILSITKNLDAKDDEGKALIWDAAMRLYPNLKKYCEDHPKIADAAKRLINRNRGMGLHAGGLIIANQPLSDLVPLVKRKDDPQASAWVEGLHGQDLGPVGLVKFDLLVISNLLQIARCCHLVKTRHNLEGICNRPGDSDWSDVLAWRNDRTALSMANSGDMKCIFQFDSEGMRALVKAGGVNRFEDLMAYASIFRPGPLGCSMDKRYIERKHGREKYHVHPIIQPIVEKTYGVLCYQEQIMKILHVVGQIPLSDCEAVRKAISKKKLEGFIKYKDAFVNNGMKTLQCSQAEIEIMWQQIEAFSEYGFNMSHCCAYTYVSAWMLYLKAHFPHEFYTSILSCETLSDKIKDYKMEAKIHGVDMERVNINKSGVYFELNGEKIIYGLSNIKGIGENPAKRIVENQPYKSFEDFLERFGTDSSVIKPLLGLRCFQERDPATLWKFSQFYKDFIKKTEDKKKRYVSAMSNFEINFKLLAPGEDCKLSDLENNPFDAEYWKVRYENKEVDVEKEIRCKEGEEGAYVKYDKMGQLIENNFYKKVIVKKNCWNLLKDLWNKRLKKIRDFSSINKVKPNLYNFDINYCAVDKKLEQEFGDVVACEEKYYGFAWIHELEKSTDYVGNLTFEILKNSINVSAGPVELQVKKVTKSKSKKGTEYHQIVAEDVTGQQNRIYIWQDDWALWSEEFTVGNLLRVRLQPPSGGFNTFMMENNYVGFNRWKKKYPNKKDDPRVVVMQRCQREEVKTLSDEELMQQFEECKVKNE